MGLPHALMNRSVRNRSGRSHRLMLGIVSAILLAGNIPTVRADGQTGYLRTTGPAPLRFRAPVSDPSAMNQPEFQAAVAPTNAIVEPLIGPTNKPATVRVTKPAPVSTVTNLITVEPAPMAADTSTTTTAASGSKAEPEPNTAQSVMPQPQLFLQYFTPEYIPNGNGYSIGLPVSFLPPQHSRASSSATYQITPANPPAPAPTDKP